MTDVFYESRSHIRKIAGVHRRAELTGLDTAFDVGVHGAVKEYFRLTDARDLPLPVDYIVAATGT